MGRSRGEIAGGDLQALRASEIGSALSSSAIARLAKGASVEDYDRDERVYERGTSASRFFVVCEGRVRVTRLAADGREVVLAHRRAGSIFGEWGLFGHATQEDTARVSEDGRVLALPAPPVRGMADADPRLQAMISVLATSRRIAAESVVEALTTRSVRSRLAEFLADAAKHDGSSDPRGIRIQSRYTHLEIACTIGATRETTTLTLDEMKRRGIVVVERRALVIRDLPKLRALI